MATYDFSALTPIERIALAETLYDSAMREIDEMVPQLTAEQVADIDRRITEVEQGQINLIPWAKVQAQFNPRQ
jgi:putative addiction module component (TIGR02574 family)